MSDQTPNPEPPDASVSAADASLPASARPTVSQPIAEAQTYAPPPPPRPPIPPAPPPPTEQPGAAAAAAAMAQERPELAAGAAFAGGLALALILKRVAR